MCIFFFKQKTAYEMRMSDWSSDVCSSDLRESGTESCGAPAKRRHERISSHDQGKTVGRPAKPLISRDRAARAALGAIDIHGLEALSLELVAQRLGVKAPSLYYHFKHKRSEEPTSELQSLMRTSSAVFCL